ncbi:asparaginyl-tRNA synthetase [Sorochytrium milnesiophthora]
MPHMLTPTLRQVLSSASPGSRVAAVNGWVRSLRVQKNVAFVDLADGTLHSGLQVVLSPEKASRLSTGTAISVDGVLQQSAGDKQQFELQADDVRVVGECDATHYPLQKKRHTFEFLRQISHLRPRGNTMSAVLRTRNELAYGLHDYFRRNGFLHVHTPILTSTDCEAGGEVFVVQPQHPPTQRSKDGSTGASDEPFFGKPAFLTVSSQLHLETVANAHPRVYTLSPAFRAETSQTPRHLSEFYMLEAECAFLPSVQALCGVVEGCVRHAAQHVLQTCADDLSFFTKRVDKGVLPRIEALAGDLPFATIEYTEAIDVLLKRHQQQQFAHPVKWGMPLQSEHERYLAETVFNGPVFVTRYPSATKPFYMLPTPSHSAKATVENFDLLLPKVVELAGGSMREVSAEAMQQRMVAAGMDPGPYQWYCDLRRYGNAPHGGFGLGFDRLLLYMTGLDSVRDVVPMPRHFGECRC